MLDLERFKRQVNYSLLPNGTATDMVMQVHGRYSDMTSYGFMGNMGIWFENFTLPVVINECLMQSYTGTINLFPNWPMENDAEFQNLRAAVAFLVSAVLKDGKTRKIQIMSEAGGLLKIVLPWTDGGIVTSGDAKKVLSSPIVEIQMEKGENICFQPK